MALFYCSPDDPYFDYETVWQEASLEERKSALIKATRYLDQFSYLGTSLDPEQELSWPRTGFAYFDGVVGSYVDVPRGSVPRRLKQATAELALHYIRYPQAAGSFEPTFDSIKLGPLELDNTNPNLDARPVPSIPGRVYALIRPLLQPTSTVTGNWWRAG